MKKYHVFGGEVVSQNDGDIHHIGPRRVAELYRVHPNDCRFFDDPFDRTYRGFWDESQAIDLYPDPSGKYDLSERLK